MKITVINKRPAGGDAVYCVDGVQVTPGAQHEMPGQDKEGLIFQLASQDDDVSVIGEIEGSDRSPLVCKMKVVADPVIDATESDGEGFDLLTEAAAAANVAPQMYVGAFEDSDCQTPHVTATLGAADTPVGTIDSGSGTNLLKVTPTTAGVFECKITETTLPETVYLKAWPVGTDYVVDSSDTASAAFTMS